LPPERIEEIRATAQVLGAAKSALEGYLPPPAPAMASPDEVAALRREWQARKQTATA
jgi:hypothetical protein